MEKKSIIGLDLDDALAKAARWLDTHVQAKSFDQTAAKQAVGNIYRASGLTVPEIWLVLDSPLEGAVAKTLLEKHVPPAGRHLSYYINKRTNTVLEKSLASHFQGSSRKKAQHGIRYSGEIQLRRHIINNILEHLPSRTSKNAGWHHVRRAFINQVEQQTTLRAKPGFTVSKHTALVESGIRAALPAVLADNSLWNLDWYLWIRHYNRAARGWLEKKLEYLVLKHACNGCANPMADAVMEAAALCDWLAFENVAIVIRRPTEGHYYYNDELCLLELHNETGPALAYANGLKFYYSHGVSLPGRLFEKPELLTPQEIRGPYDSEARRVMILWYGIERFLRDIQAPAVSSDECGRLFKVKFEHGEPFAAVMVRNSTPEADGTYKNHYLTVPPDMKTAREAVAWTFGLSAEEYALTEEA